MSSASPPARSWTGDQSATGLVVNGDNVETTGSPSSTSSYLPSSVTSFTGYRHGVATPASTRA
jgi:hypothetical protein